MDLLKKILRRHKKEKQNYNWHEIDGKEYAYLKQFNGSVERELIEAGVDKISIEVGKSIVQIYRHIKNIEQGRITAKLGAGHPAYLSAPGHVQVMEEDGSYRTFEQHELWNTPEESGDIFRRLISEDLTKIPDEEYQSLPEGLKKIVDKGRKLALQ